MARRKRTKTQGNDWMRGYDAGIKEGRKIGYKKAINNLLDFIDEVYQ